MPRVTSKMMAQYLPDLLTGQDATSSSSTDSSALSASSIAYSKLAAKKYVKDNDKNKDGALTQDEVTLSKESFEKLDQDKSGGLSQSEMQSGLSGSEDTLYSYFAKGNVKLMKTTAMQSFLKYI